MTWNTCGVQLYARISHVMREDGLRGMRVTMREQFHMHLFISKNGFFPETWTIVNMTDFFYVKISF